MHNKDVRLVIIKYLYDRLPGETNINPLLETLAQRERSDGPGAGTDFKTTIAAVLEDMKRSELIWYHEVNLVYLRNGSPDQKIHVVLLTAGMELWLVHKGLIINQQILGWTIAGVLFMVITAFFLRN